MTNPKTLIIIIADKEVVFEVGKQPWYGTKPGDHDFPAFRKYIHYYVHKIVVYDSIKRIVVDYRDMLDDYPDVKYYSQTFYNVPYYTPIIKDDD